MTRRRSPNIAFRRSRHLVCYWRGAEFVVRNYATGAQVVAPVLTCEILDFFSDWQPLESLLADRPPPLRAALERAVHVLCENSLLSRSDRGTTPAEDAMNQWATWNPAAGLFHSACKDVSFVDLETQVRTLRAKSRREVMPDPVKRYPAAGRVPLKITDQDGEFRSVLLARRTWRRFSSQPIDAAAFGTLMALTAGIQRWTNATGEGRVALKTSPSGGARHAIEVYVVALRVRGIRKGIYHYAPDAHALEPISRNVTRRKIEEFLPNQRWYRGAAALVVFAALFQRELWRYPYPRAYRALCIEAGHLCQTFCLTATWLGLAPFCSMALADAAIERDLRIDGIGEAPLYAAGVGARPRNAHWQPRVIERPRVLTGEEARHFPGLIKTGTTDRRSASVPAASASRAPRRRS